MQKSMRVVTGGWALCAAVACGDSGRQNDDGSASAGLSTGAPMTTSGSTGAPTSSASQTASDAGSASATQGMTTTGTTAPVTTSESASGTTMAIESTGAPETTGSTGDGTTGDPCGGGMGGVFDFSYLWVANTDQGSISKVNTREAANSGDYAGIRRVA